MADVTRCLIVTASNAPLARALAEGLSPAGGRGMFTTPLSATGALPATHFISEGWIDEDIASLLTSGPALHAACVAAGASVTLAQCNALVSQSDVSIEEPFEAINRLNLKLIVE